MKERDYIDATNLAKLRIARNVLADCYITESGQAVQHRSAILCIDELIKAAEEKVVTK